MIDPKTTGRVVGMLLLVQLITGLILPYILLLPLSTPAGAFLERADAVAGTLKLSVLMLFVGGAAALAIALSMWPAVRERQTQVGLWLISLAVMNFTLQLIENIHWLTMLSVSEAHGSAAGANSDEFASLALLLHGSFRWAHYTHILIVVTWLFTLCLLLYRTAMAPRLLAASGMAAALLHFLGITLPAFAGYRMPFADLFGAPLGLVVMTLSVWLMTKGFAQNSSPETQLRPGD